MLRRLEKERQSSNPFQLIFHQSSRYIRNPAPLLQQCHKKRKTQPSWNSNNLIKKMFISPKCIWVDQLLRLLSNQCILYRKVRCHTAYISNLFCLLLAPAEGFSIQPRLLFPLWTNKGLFMPFRQKPNYFAHFRGWGGL